MKFSLCCELNYLVRRDTTMILNIEAQRVEGQTIAQETFSVTPDEIGRAACRERV